MRTLTYAQAIREGFAQSLKSDPSVFIIGQGVWAPWYVGSSMKDLEKEFGKERVIDCPVSENGTTGAAIGAAIAGMRPVVIHPRVDFLLLAVDQVVNEAANWSYMFGGRSCVPMTIRPIINRGGEQAAQHSQALQAFFAHVPGLKVVMPTTPYDAKGLLIASIQDNNPVIYIDDRWLYEEEGEVPEEMYQVPIGKGVVRRPGRDVTIVAVSFMVIEAMKAAKELEQTGVEVEVIDVRSLKPLDEEIIFQSVEKHGQLVVADAAWMNCGFAAGVAARVASQRFQSLKAPILRVTLPDVPAPMSKPLEDVYFPKAKDIVRAVKQTLASEKIKQGV